MSTSEIPYSVNNPRPLPSYEELSALFEYDPESGEIINRKTGEVMARRANKRSGYRRLGIGGAMYYAHRVCWALHYGEDPGEMIVDHINRNRGDNRISNLRLVTRYENGLNRFPYGTSPYENRVRESQTQKSESVSVTVSLNGIPTEIQLNLDSSVTLTTTLDGIPATLTVSLST